MLPRLNFVYSVTSGVKTTMLADMDVRIVKLKPSRISINFEPLRVIPGSFPWDTALAYTLLCVRPYSPKLTVGTVIPFQVFPHAHTHTHTHTFPGNAGWENQWKTSCEFRMYSGCILSGNLQNRLAGTPW